jgi:hypothetical protein
MRHEEQLKLGFTTTLDEPISETIVRALISTFACVHSLWVHCAVLMCTASLHADERFAASGCKVESGSDAEREARGRAAKAARLYVPIGDRCERTHPHSKLLQGICGARFLYVCFCQCKSQTCSFGRIINALLPLFWQRAQPICPRRPSCAYLFCCVRSRMVRSGCCHSKRTTARRDNVSTTSVLHW